MKSILLTTIYLLFVFLAQAQNDLPKLTVTGAEFTDAGVYHISYEINDADSDLFEVSVLMSKDKGLTYEPYDEFVDGDGQVNGVGDHILSLNYTEFDAIRIVVDDLFEFSIEEVVASVDSNRLRDYLESIVGIRHYIEDPGKLEEVRDFVHTELHNTCRDTSSQSFLYNNIWEGKNLFGWQQGTTTDKEPFLVGGHYDSVDESPGADDNGTAVAGMLEISKVFEDFGFNYPIMYSAWDFEEQGLVGSTFYVTNKEADIDIQAYLNLEMIGYYSDKPNSQTLPVGFDFLFPEITAQIADNEFRGDFLTNVGNAGSSNQLMQDFESISSTYVPELSVISVPSPGEGTSVPDLLRSDHAPFWFQGIPAVMLTDGSEFRNKNYHTPLDVIDSLDFEFYSNVVKASVAYLAEKAEIHHKGVAQVSIDDFTTHISNPEVTSLITCNYVQGSKFLSIHWNESVSAAIDWKLVDMQGRMIEAGNLSQSGVDSKITLEELIPGAYIFSAIDDHGATLTYQFVVE